jgi:pyruvate/2-oxoglutarate/acetoin dehydrogenase E1 component
MTFKPYSKYHKAICQENLKLAEDPRVIFLGQQTASESHYSTLEGISLDRRLEMPIAEEMQMSISLGLSLQGFLPVSIYQRIDFLPRAADAIVNHLNSFEELSRGLYKPRVIIRTTLGIKSAGIQHSQDLTELMEVMCKFPVRLVTTPEEVHVAYDFARKTDKSILIIENQSLYYE